MLHVQNYLKQLYNQMKEENELTLTQGQEEGDFEDSQLH